MCISPIYMYVVIKSCHWECKQPGKKLVKLAFKGILYPACFKMAASL